MKILITTLVSFVSFSALAAQSLYEIPVKPLMAEKAETLSQYKGKVLLIVNTASECGYTPQYKGLQSLYQSFSKDGFAIVAFPSNDFGQQEPGSSKEIKKFCETKYHVTFPLYEKNPVSGKNKQPLYSWLISHDPGEKNSEVKWNFEKFLISREGKVLARFRSKVEPESDELVTAVKNALTKK